MIKINLNRTRVPGNSGQEEGTTIDQLTESNPRDLAVKLIVMFLGPLTLFVTQSLNLSRLQGEFTGVQGQLTKLKSELDAKKKELDSLKDIQAKSIALQDKLTLLKKYSRLRLFQLQALDYLQSVIPERVWVTTIDYIDRRYKILGRAVDTVDLTDFVNKLEGSAYFQDVIVVQNKDYSISGSNSKIRDWEISTKSEVKE